jgi:hypothetical protein
MINKIERLVFAAAVVGSVIAAPCISIDWAAFDFSANYDEPPIAVITVKPVFPDDMSVNGATELLLAVLVDVEGKVGDVVILEDDISPEVAAAVIEAVSQNRYEPAKYQGMPVEVWYMISVPVTRPDENTDNSKSPSAIVPKGLERK